MITHRSSNTKIVTVDENGNINAVGAGTTIVYTEVELYSGKVKSVMTMITVKEPSIRFIKSVSTMKVGDQFTFEAEAIGIDSNKIKWQTTEKSIVVIDSQGNAVAKSKGTDYVQVKIGNITKKMKVVVK